MPRDAEAQADFESARRNQEAGQLEAAQTLYFKILARDPIDGECLHQLARTLGERRQLGPAASSFRIALKLMPDSVAIQIDLARTLYHLGAAAEAALLLRKAARRQPAAPDIRADLAQMALPALYRCAADIPRARQRYRQALARLQTIASAAPGEALPAAGGTIPPFFLAYQCRNDRRLQQRWGDYLTRTMAAAYPSWTVAPDVPPPRPGEPVRVGILSSYFHYHSNWKIPIKGWLRALDPGRFQLYGYHLGTLADSETDEAASRCHRFVRGPKRLAEWAQLIRDDRLHVLLIPGIGMDSLTGKLAALRLAPVQATSFGHPETTGLRTIDHFLTGALMEPAGAEAHYSEGLVRLANLGLWYEPPEIVPGPMTRQEIGVAAADVVYWCCQGLYKYLPQHDWVYPRIAAAVPAARFVFIGFPHNPAITEMFRERLGAAFTAAGLAIDEHCRFLPFLDPADFAAVTRLADVFLDSIGWSGLNSTLEALGADLPVITTPGRLMRGRHGAALLTMLGMPELIARDAEGLVELAIALGLDASRRTALRRRIAATKGRLYRDQAAIDGLADYLETAARGLAPA